MLVVGGTVPTGLGHHEQWTRRSRKSKYRATNWCSSRNHGLTWGRNRAANDSAWDVPHLNPLSSPSTSISVWRVKGRGVTPQTRLNQGVVMNLIYPYLCLTYSRRFEFHNSRPLSFLPRVPWSNQRDVTHTHNMPHKCIYARTR